MSKIEFIIPTYNRPDLLMCTINSIVAQRSDKWKIHVVADCPPEGTLDKIMKYFEGDERIKFTILPERYNDWGHTPRNYGMEHATEDWVVMTGEDNYYVPVFVDHFLGAVSGKRNVHFVFCNMVHNWTNFQYYAIDCSPKKDEIDIGNFMVRRKFGNKIKLNVTRAAADGEYVEEYLKQYPMGVTLKINKILYVHN
jgi:glycosyltransferase involved in cell wall biosynthesis